MFKPGHFTVLLAIIFLKSSFGFDDDGPVVYRKVVCREGRFDFKNVQCLRKQSEQPLIALHHVMFGYLNESANCTESEDTMGCEEPMSDTQTTYILQRGSAQPAMTALQFPAVGDPTQCKGFGKDPNYMAFTFECVEKSSIIEMCKTTTKTGPRLSVYNPGYPGMGYVPRTHHCVCDITSSAPVIEFTIYDYQLNCTGNEQNLTITDENVTVLDPICNSFKKGQRNSSNQNLTMVWKGQRRMAGRFWIGFHAANAAHNVSVDCYSILDPTTTTSTTTTTTTTTTPLQTSSPSVVVSPSLETSKQGPPGTTIKTLSVTPRDHTPAKRQRKPMPKTLIYALAGSAGVVIFIIIIVCVVIVRRRDNVEISSKASATSSSF